MSLSRFNLPVGYRNYPSTTAHMRQSLGKPQ